jgi:hypothetical protein
MMPAPRAPAVLGPAISFDDPKLRGNRPMFFQDRAAWRFVPFYYFRRDGMWSRMKRISNFRFQISAFESGI